MIADEKPSLQPLPIELFRHHGHGECVDYLDGCVEVEAVYCRCRWVGLAARSKCTGITRTSGC